ncbi:MAG: glycosyltransferase family 1 protein [Acidocella sp.]|nr:glycosyltransferase family 1 protein [Acidocella sp.]
MEPILINGRFTTQNITGVQRFATELSSALVSGTSRRVSLLAPHGAAPKADTYQIGRAQGHLWEQWDLPRLRPPGILLNLGNTAPILARRQVAVIHDCGVFSTPEAYSAKFRLLYKAMHTALIRRGTPIVTVSEFSKSEILRHLPARPDQISVMPEGADHVARIGEDPSILARHGLAPGKFVLAVGTLSAHKNLAGLQSLATCLAARNIPLVIVGQLGNQVFRADGTALLPHPAQYIGRVTDEALKSLYRAAACFVFPSKYEGFGLPVAEAMASHCPVVAADIPALREIFGSAALFCNPHDPEHITATVIGVLDNPALQDQLRERGQKCTAAMSWARAASTMVAIIDRIFPRQVHE